MPYTILFIYIASLCIQLFSIFLLSEIYQRGRLIFCCNFLIVISVFIAILNHLYFFLKNYSQSQTAFTDSVLMLINSIVFSSIIFYIFIVTKQMVSKISKLNMKVKYDPLTKALSREKILAKCEREINRATRSKTIVSLLTIDLDHFKNINDLYGHPIGDEVLIRSTKYCKELLREMDLIGRIGGDEFIILLPNTDIHLAREVAERIQIRMKDLINHLSIRTLHPISLSIGIACYNPQEINGAFKSIGSKNILKNLIEQSDKALYDAKKRGRSQCVIAVDAAHPKLRSCNAQ